MPSRIHTGLILACGCLLLLNASAPLPAAAAPAVNQPVDEPPPAVDTTPRNPPERKMVPMDLLQILHFQSYDSPQQREQALQAYLREHPEFSQGQYQMSNGSLLGYAFGCQFAGLANDLLDLHAPTYFFIYDECLPIHIILSERWHDPQAQHNLIARLYRLSGLPPFKSGESVFIGFLGHADLPTLQYLETHFPDDYRRHHPGAEDYPLHRLTGNNHPDVVATYLPRLLAEGYAINEVTPRGYTPLQSAIYNNAPLETFRLLLDHGADPNLATPSPKRSTGTYDAFDRLFSYDFQCGYMPYKDFRSYHLQRDRMLHAAALTVPSELKLALYLILFFTMAYLLLRELRTAAAAAQSPPTWRQLLNAILFSPTTRPRLRRHTPDHDWQRHWAAAAPPPSAATTLQQLACTARRRMLLLSVLTQTTLFAVLAFDPWVTHTLWPTAISFDYFLTRHLAWLGVGLGLYLAALIVGVLTRCHGWRRGAGLFTWLICAAFPLVWWLCLGIDYIQVLGPGYYAILAFAAALTVLNGQILRLGIRQPHTAATTSPISPADDFAAEIPPTWDTASARPVTPTAD